MESRRIRKGRVNKMRKYRTEQEGQLAEVICNGCGRELKVENGCLKEWCFSADVSFGYFSSRDGMRHHFELCEDCYDKMIGRFAVPVDEMEQSELL